MNWTFFQNKETGNLIL